jgi:phosphohistidine phosphatase
MELILWRHAEAASGDPDSARPLTDRGRAQSQVMARWLAQRLPADLRMIVSPARRAQETALALGRSFETIEVLAPGCDVATLLGIAGWPDGERTVLVVGHQPTLGEIAAHLVDGQDSSWRIGTGAVWWLKGRQHKGRGDAAEILLALEPEILEREGPT